MQCHNFLNAELFKIHGRINSKSFCTRNAFAWRVDGIVIASFRVEIGTARERKNTKRSDLISECISLRKPTRSAFGTIAHSLKLFDSTFSVFTLNATRFSMANAILLARTQKNEFSSKRILQTVLNFINNIAVFRRSNYARTNVGNTHKRRV